MPLTRGPWFATAYLLSYPIVAAPAFGIGAGLLMIDAIIGVTWFVLPLLVITAAVARAMATVERWRTRLVGELPEPEYQPVEGTGVWAHVRAYWRDRATYRDCLYLVAMFVPLLVLDVVVVVLWLVCLAGIALPAWYWAVSVHWRGGPTLHGVPLGYLPHGPGGPDGFGVWIGSPLAAIIAAIASAAVAILLTYVVVGAAILHRAVARGLLGPYVDPLAESKNVLAGPGPLPALERLERHGGS